MRVTNRMIGENTIRHLGDTLERLAELQEEVASGKSVRKPSDDPSAASIILNIRSNLKANQAYHESAVITSDWLSATEFSIGQMVDIASQALVLAEQGIPDTVSANERLAMASEMEGLLQAAIAAGNTTHRSDNLFSGFSINTQPFTLVPGVPDTVSYSGDAGVILHAIGPGQSVTVNIDANTMFTPLFTALIKARDELTANNPAQIQVAFGMLEIALDDIINERTAIGARQRRVKTAIDLNLKTELALRSLLSLKEDASLTEAVTHLQQQETVYQSVLEAGRRALATPNLFDFLGFR